MAVMKLHPLYINSTYVQSVDSHSTLEKICKCRSGD